MTDTRRTPSVAATFVKVAAVVIAVVSVGVALAALTGNPVSLVFSLVAAWLGVPIVQRDTAARRLAMGGPPAPGPWLAATRFAVSDRLYQLPVGATRRVYASGRLQVTEAHARFETDRAGRQWTPSGAPTQVELFPMQRGRATTLRVTCAAEAGQFFVQMPTTEVHEFLARSVPRAFLQSHP
ncbi:MAG: hypothetical protein ACT4OX_06775 [Actinomycetota bacterium]